METLQIALDWVQANPWIALAIAVYVIVNVAPRPHPEQMVGWKRTVWAIIDGLCLLTAAKVPGRVKWIVANSPALQPAETGQAPEPEVVVEPEDEADDDGAEKASETQDEDEVEK